MIEEFRDVVGYEGIYKVSNLGRVKSLKFNRERILRGGKGIRGYLTVGLIKDGKQKTRRVHQLVAEAFLDHTPCGFKLVVNHINFIRHDNRAENLELDTTRNNCNKKHLKSSSEYVGVSWNKKANKWKAAIHINGKQKYLGYFTCELKAAYAYQKALNAL